MTIRPKHHPDCPWPELLVIRVARKAHECCNRHGPTSRWNGEPVPESHTDTILPGEVYVEYVGEAAAYQAGTRYCRGCAEHGRMILPEVAG